MENELKVNFERLKNNILSLSEIGKSEDRGIYRMAFTDADMQARKWLMDRIEKAGMEPSMDGAANVFGKLNCRDEITSVMVGSHLDTVPAGGHLDGALGVMVALECLTRIREDNLQTDYGLEMVAFSDEEGRFGGPFGSLALCGELIPDKIFTAADLDNVLLADEMKRHGLDPMEALHARRNPDSIHAFLELHIEQGPVLDRKGYQIGVVEDITGLFKWVIRLIGEPDHAGTTPMDMRRDALMGLAEFIGEIPRIIEENGSDGSVATVGKVALSPGIANTIPGQVEFSLDVRDTSQEILDELGDAIRRALSAIGRRRSLMFEFDIISEVNPVKCDKEISSKIANRAENMTINFHRMPSGAVHDTQIMSSLTRVGMIFVPSKDGRSHSPAEWTHWEDIETGANLMLNSLLDIAGRK